MDRIARLPPTQVNIGFDRQALTEIVAERALERCMIALRVDDCLTTLGHAARERAQ